MNINNELKKFRKEKAQEFFTQELPNRLKGFEAALEGTPEEIKKKLEDQKEIYTLNFWDKLDELEEQKKKSLELERDTADILCENEEKPLARSAKRRQREVSLHKPVSVGDDGGELLVMDILRDEEDISKHVEDEAEIMILRNAIKKLSSRDQTIIKLLFGLENTEKKSQEEVASYFKVTQSIISRRKARSLRRLRTEMERYM